MISPHLSQFNGRHIDSWYAASCTHDITFTPLGPEAANADVCIIGAGFTGLSCALALAEQGVQVTVLEGGLVGFGASGRNGGQVLHGFACPTDLIKRQLGDTAARLCWEMSQHAVGQLAQRVERHNIDCSLTWGYLTAASTAKQLKHLQQIEQQLHDYNYHQTRLLSQTELAQQINSQAYVGGLFDAGCGHLHPLCYAQGLAQAAAEAGVTIYEQTRAIKIDTRTDSVQISCGDGGQITAKHLVLACNVDIGGLDADLGRRFLPVISHIIATQPLSIEHCKRLLPNNAAVCDSNHVLNYYRLSNDQRMLFGGRLKSPSADPISITQQRRAELAQIFPSLANTRIDYSWGGYIDIGLNKAPQFGRKNQLIYYAQGFAGHGVALTGLAGQLIADAILQESAGFDLFAQIKSPPIPLHKLTASALIRCGVAFYRLRDRLGY